MRIVLAHNYYGSSAPSGENVVFAAESALLRDRGNTVLEFTRHSDEIRGTGIRGTLAGAFSTPWNPFSKRALERLIQRERPSIIHVHNSFPLLSPSIYHINTKEPVARVLTLHNYRIFCAAGIPMRAGLPCTKCLDWRSISPGLQYGCYRNSRAATIPMGVMIALHRRLHTWTSQVDAFIALTPFQKDVLCSAGLPRDKVHIKPHFYPDPPSPLPWNERDEKVVFVGRLGLEKGVHVLIDAWRQFGARAPLLELIGDGPERSSIERRIQESGLADRIALCGQLPFPAAQEKIARARLLILPSLWFEAFGLVVLEALALGVPVAASRIGSLPCMIDDGVNGVLFEPGNPNDLCRKLQLLWSSQDMLKAYSIAARNEFESKHTADTNYEIMMDIYTKAIERRLSSDTRNGS
jgi:glycosyltransferase involved in cell wall biosynthesis